jgi:hypothetical protein
MVRRVGFGAAVRAAGALYDMLPCKRPALSMIRPLHLPHSLYMHLHFMGEFEVATAKRPFRIIHYGDEIENELFWEGLPGRRERVSMGLWVRLAQQARGIADIGANTGVYALVAAAMNANAQIYGFEPLQVLFDRFDRNCRLNGFDISRHRVALSDEAGAGRMCGWVLERSGSDANPLPSSGSMP